MTWIMLRNGDLVNLDRVAAIWGTAMGIYFMGEQPDAEGGPLCISCEEYEEGEEHLARKRLQELQMMLCSQVKGRVS